jgi:hypothetical protein
MTTELPSDAGEVYATAIPADPRNPGTSWWGQNAAMCLYRYGVHWSGGKPFAHWNGTTERSGPRTIEDREVPASIREAFPKRER